MGTACSLCALCALPLRPLCNPCATPVQPLCNPLRIPLFWPPFDHFVRGLFEIDLGYWSTGYRDTDPQNQKWVWDTDPQDTGILIHKIKNVFGILIHGSFWAILQRSLFFQRAGREGSDQNFFLPRVPKFKLDQTGWLHGLSSYTTFTQAWEITVKDRTIVTWL